MSLTTLALAFGLIIKYHNYKVCVCVCGKDFFLKRNSREQNREPKRSHRISNPHQEGATK